MAGPITIRQITVRECRQTASFRGTYSCGEKDPEKNVWFFVSLSDGVETGYGECVPTSLYYEPGHVGRSGIDEWAELLSLARSLIGGDARALSNLITEDFENDDANSIKDALDFALHDMVGRRLGVPVAALLGGIARPFVYGMPVVFRDTPDRMADRAAELHARFGFRYFKLKPAGTWEEDVETLAKMRERMGPEVRYCADANYSLKVEGIANIARYMDDLHALGLEIYEDPIPVDLATYRELRERTQVRIMIDEHARTAEDVMRIVQERAADQINIHANWAGGFRPAIRKAQIARLGGMLAMIGSVSYLGPGAAAYQTLASVVGDAPCEQCFNDAVGRGPQVGTSYPLRDGKYFIADAPGLGFDPNMDMVESLTVRCEIVAE
jgi:L-alanine-DL-glutamate epimerase-like enolase superfamily enzyme